MGWAFFGGCKQTFPPTPPPPPPGTAEQQGNAKEQTPDELLAAAQTLSRLMNVASANAQDPELKQKLDDMMSKLGSSEVMDPLGAPCFS